MYLRNICVACTCYIFLPVPALPHRDGIYDFVIKTNRPSAVIRLVALREHHELDRCYERMRKIVCCVLFVNFIQVVLGSGFYIDNGIDQTVREKSIPLQERQEIEHEILELLGLPDRPNTQHVHPSLR